LEKKLPLLAFSADAPQFIMIQNGVDFGEKSHLFKIREKLWY
jgi:hypothetical protein